MAGRGFQVVLTAADVVVLFANIRRHLEACGPRGKSSGRLVTEAVALPVETPRGEKVEVSHGAVKPLELDVIEFSTTFRSRADAPESFYPRNASG